MKRKKRIVYWVTAFLAIAIISSGVYAKTPITIYSSVHEDVLAAIAKEFNSRTPDVELKYFRLGTTKIIAKVNAEVKAGGIRADLVWTAEPAYFEELKQRGLIVKYLSPAAKDIPKLFIDPDGYYIGARILSIGLMYNTKLVKEADAPRDWNDLLDPQWKNQIVHASPLYSGSVTATVTGLTQSPKLGWAYYEKLRTNGITIVKAQAGAQSKVAGGEYKVGIGLDYGIRKMTAKGSPIQFVYPKSGSVTWGSPIAIFKASEHQDAAKKFIDFVVSPEGQKFLITEYIVSVNPKVSSPKGAPPLMEILHSALPVDWAYLVKNREELLKKWSRLMEE
jgi:iron(III) transport system substrate-binding protein